MLDLPSFPVTFEVVPKQGIIRIQNLTEIPIQVIRESGDITSLSNSEEAEFEVYSGETISLIAENGNAGIVKVLNE